MTPRPYRFVALPKQWPGKQRPLGWHPIRSPFKAHNWSKIERELLAELSKVRAKDITLALDVRSPGEFREDGGLRSDAAVSSPRVVLSFTKGDKGVRLTFPCDAYGAWQDNVWAIRLTLEYLRAIDRYGVTQGDQQYVGFAALPPARKHEMTLDDAIALLQEHGESPASVDLLTAPAWLMEAVQKRARAATHPDAGGSTEAFQNVEKAVALIAAARGAR